MRPARLDVGDRWMSLYNHVITEGSDAWDAVNRLEAHIGTAADVETMRVEAVKAAMHKGDPSLIAAIEGWATTMHAKGGYLQSKWTS